VAGEVSISEPEPGGVLDPPRREERARVAQAPKLRREDPPVVSGEVAITPPTSQSPAVPTGDVYVMSTSTSGPQPVMTASGPQPVMTASGAHPVVRPSGPQPIMTASGAQPVVRPSGSQPIMTASGAQPVVRPSGSQPVMTASGAQPVMTASGASPVVPRRSSTDPGPARSEITGPQPPGQAEATGPHPVLLRPRDGSDASRDSLVLWTLAGTLVVLAVGVVMMLISWFR
jgi:hypothetical protein